MQIKASNASLTYIWKPISKTDPTKFIEIIFTMIVLIVSLVSIVFLFYIIPYTKLDYFCEQYPLVWMGFTVQWLSSIGLEIYHTIETYGDSMYTNMRILITVVGQLVIDILCIIIILWMVIMFVCVYKRTKHSPVTLKIAYYVAIVTFGWSLLRQLIILSFYAFVYATEPISTIGIVAFGIIFTIAWSYLSTGVYKKVWTINCKICHECVKWLLLIIFGLIDVFVYLSINVITYFTIMVYITFWTLCPNLHQISCLNSFVLFSRHFWQLVSPSAWSGGRLRKRLHKRAQIPWDKEGYEQVWLSNIIINSKSHRPSIYPYYYHLLCLNIIICISYSIMEDKLVVNIQSPSYNTYLAVIRL